MSWSEGVRPFFLLLVIRGEEGEGSFKLCFVVESGLSTVQQATFHAKLVFVWIVDCSRQSNWLIAKENWTWEAPHLMKSSIGEAESPAQAKSGGKHFLDTKSFMQPMKGLISMDSWGVQFFFLSGKLTGRIFFFIFSLVLISFPMCSHEVPKRSHIPLQTFPIAPHFLLCHSVCPKFNSHVGIINWKGGPYGAHMFLFCNRAFQQGDSSGECPMFPKNLMMGQSTWPLQKRKKKKKSAHRIAPHPWSN